MACVQQRTACFQAVPFRYCEPDLASIAAFYGTLEILRAAWSPSWLLIPGTNITDPNYQLNTVEQALMFSCVAASALTHVAIRSRQLHFKRILSTRIASGLCLFQCISYLMQACFFLSLRQCSRTIIHTAARCLLAYSM